MLFKKQEQSGDSIIANAISTFSQIKDELQRGIHLSTSKVQELDEEILRKKNEQQVQKDAVGQALKIIKNLDTLLGKEK